MILKLQLPSQLLYFPSKIAAAQKPLTFKRRVFLDRIVMASIYAAAIATAIFLS